MTWKDKIQTYNKRSDIALFDTPSEAVQFAAEHFIAIAEEAIQKHGSFSVALSGGSTPKALFEELTRPEHRNKIDWRKGLFFWSDERAVPPNHPDSNYHMAMTNGLQTLGIPGDHIFRMHAEVNIEDNALVYEQAIKKHVPSGSFDLMMLGMGDDGHTASLFPRTHGLHADARLAIANYVPQKQCWRMSLTFECINNAAHSVVYVLGKNKAEMLKKVLTGPHMPDDIPIQNVGLPQRHALWIVDRGAAGELLDVNGKQSDGSKSHVL